MDAFTDDEEDVREVIRAFLDNELEPHHEEFIGSPETDREFWRKAGRAGILGSALPEEYGGAGLSDIVAILLAWELGRSVGGATVGSSLESDFATHILVTGGSEEQKRRLAPGILSGDVTQAVALTEPDAGSDMTAMRTSAVRDGDDYVLNGTKVFITNGNKAEAIYLAAKTDPSKRGSGISLFLVEGNPEGLSRTRLETMGYPAYDLAELHFDNVRLRADSLLLGEGRAMPILMETFDVDRLQIAARALGEAELALRLALEHVRSRDAFGQKVFDFQNTQFVLAEMKADVEVGVAMLHEAVRKHRAGALPGHEASMVKLWIPQMSSRVVDKALQFFGGSGYMDEMPISRIYSGNRLHRIYAGTDEIQKVTIARRMLAADGKASVVDVTDPYTDDEQAARRTIRAFLDAELEPHHDELADIDRDREFWRRAGKAGILGSVIPDEYGGPGMSPLISVIMSHELGRSIGGATVGSSLSVDMSTHILMDSGPEHLKRELAAGIMAGDVIQCGPITEPDAGSDITSVRTTADREGDHYILNGSKVFICNGVKADWMYVLARTDRSQKGARGLSMIAVDASTPGVSRRRLKAMGCPAYDIAEIHFDDVRVPTENILRGEGRAMEVLMATFAFDRFQVAARALGEAELALKLAVEHVRNREAFGQRLSDFQNTQFVLAEMQTDVAAGTALLNEGIRKYRAGNLDFAGSAVIKLWIPQMTTRVLDKALQLFGGSGFMQDMPIARIYKAARLHRIYAGTDEMQKIAIARAL